MSSPIAPAVKELLSAPLEQARGLPNEAFTTPEFLALENRTLFSRNWVFAGRISSLPDPNAIVMTEVAGDPLIIVRDKEGDIRVFYNVCPHRGAKIVTEDRSRAPAITCKYHAWSFDLSGPMRGRPNFHGPGKHDPAKRDDPNCPHLFEVRTAFWNDGIFVNLDGNAPPLEEYLAPLTKQAEGFDISQFNYSCTVTGEFNCNWKLAIENWSDVYHVFAVHPGLNEMMDADKRTGMTTDGNLIYCRWGYDQETLDQEELPVAENLQGQAARSSFNGHLFPGLGISFHPTMFLFWDYKPVSHDWTRLSLHIYFAGDAAHSETHAHLRDAKVKYYTGLNAEDDEVCRLLQEGRHARGYDGGRFSPYWDAGTLHLARLVASSVS